MVEKLFERLFGNAMVAGTSTDKLTGLGMGIHNYKGLTNTYATYTDSAGSCPQHDQFADAFNEWQRQQSAR